MKIFEFNNIAEYLVILLKSLQRNYKQKILCKLTFSTNTKQEARVLCERCTNKTTSKKFPGSIIFKPFSFFRVSEESP